MGIAIKDSYMAVASLGSVLVLRNQKEMAQSYPGSPNQYDALYMPRTSYHTGMLDIHDISWGDEGLWAVNTQFSCLALIDEHYSFTPKWQPHFITELKPQDRCHLNGLCLEDGKPAYVSALGSEDTPGSWRNTKIGGGVVMH